MCFAWLGVLFPLLWFLFAVYCYKNILMNGRYVVPTDWDFLFISPPAIFPRYLACISSWRTAVLPSHGEWSLSVIPVDFFWKTHFHVLAYFVILYAKSAIDEWYYDIRKDLQNMFVTLSLFITSRLLSVSLHGTPRGMEAKSHPRPLITLSWVLWRMVDVSYTGKSWVSGETKCRRTISSAFRKDITYRRTVSSALINGMTCRRTIAPPSGNNFTCRRAISHPAGHDFTYNQPT